MCSQTEESRKERREREREKDMETEMNLYSPGGTSWKEEEKYPNRPRGRSAE